MQAVVLQHVSFEGPALIAAALTGTDVRVIRLDLGESLPNAAEIGALIVLGGPMGALGPDGPRLPVVHWHGDTFDLPDGATLLARSDAYPHQAFRFGRAYGLQFHAEFEAAAVQDAAPHLPPGTVIDPTAMRTVTATGERVLARWATHALRRSTPFPPRHRPRLVDHRWFNSDPRPPFRSRGRHGARRGRRPARLRGTDRGRHARQHRGADRVLDRRRLLLTTRPVALSPTGGSATGRGQQRHRLTPAETRPSPDVSCGDAHLAGSTSDSNSWHCQKNSGGAP